MNRSLEKIVTDWVANNSKVIDFGCGEGTFLREAQKVCEDVIGIEIDIRACSQLGSTHGGLFRKTYEVEDICATLHDIKLARSGVNRVEEY